MGGKLVSRRSLLKWILLSIILIFIGLFIANTDFTATWQALRGIGFQFLYLMAISYVAYFFGTWSWHVCLGEGRSKISLLQLFSVRQVGETVGQYNPTSIIGGDLLKAELLQPYHIPQRQALHSVALSRITTVLSQVCLLLLASLWLLFQASHSPSLSRLVPNLYLFIGLLILFHVLFFYWLLRKAPAVAGGAASQPQSFWRRWIKRLQLLLQDIRNSYQANPKLFWQSYLLAAIHWLIGSLEFYLILHLLGYPIQLMEGLLLDMSVIAFKSLGAFIPGQLGVEELGNKLLLGMLGIGSGTVWITVSILRRARQLAWIGLGFILYFFLKKDLKHVHNEA